MKRTIYFFTFIFLLVSISSYAQQRLNPKGMTYLIMQKPNNIVFHDTVFTGSKQFKELFYRTHDDELIMHYQKHQCNKVTGQIMSFVGTVAMIVGIRKLSDDDQKGFGWGLIGGGFVSALTGGYLTYKGQQHLQMAVTLFNQKYHQAALGIGVSQNTAGLVYNF
ncbi:MAG: hypothetical protein ABIS69_10395 [Sediminibacterium sp.]